MATSCYSRASSIIALFVGFLLLLPPPVLLLPPPEANTTHHSRVELETLRRVRARLRKLQKPSLKTIQSGEGDIIDCVPSHLQPAFDHPKLLGQKPLGRRRRRTRRQRRVFSRGLLPASRARAGTVPIRRATEADVLRASSVKRFGRKPAARRRPLSATGGHEHAVGYVIGDQYFGAKASLNFSLSQIWVISGSFGDDLNTIEAGWQVSPELYGDAYPRFFTYWTSDSYQTTGCYNLLCSGFVQTTNKFAIGTAISPISTYGGSQFDISLLIWKDPKQGHWWLEFGGRLIVGYWPSELFSHLGQHATMVQFGGEVVNGGPAGGGGPSYHTATEMGSGRFSGEGFGRASYFRNLQVVDWDNSLVPPPALRLLADRPACYDIRGGLHPSGAPTSTTAAPAGIAAVLVESISDARLSLSLFSSLLTVSSPSHFLPLLSLLSLKSSSGEVSLSLLSFMGVPL
ncbi:unnamed protein product [Spirodela intermedia]|uniref:Neprosin PEP catalytic domain-containing protein n=1 Tax=Spirodela intermedia TaxID=51605 RepID=A0A7I8JSD4_SPIIN|nr:unnamed protein product [Spirodela intermedia]CAA6673090.1 unnamed protein product [Spirodela intermedia]